ncbi:hypothetical protein HCJ93_27210 [Streptomyces sp. SBST2-5]|uniref:Uncharacterized protein n=1 Tax=Streptomyces composti TaxID=2720025 RepID=A0ABX1AEP8_9ACTN|nr:hypothetical protein [Streptomyces composti]NJP53655.1 hypothetical protein [Streptomyces composti]
MLDRIRIAERYTRSAAAAVTAVAALVLAAYAGPAETRTDSRPDVQRQATAPAADAVRTAAR